MAFELINRRRNSKEFFEINLIYLFIVGLWPKDSLSPNQLLLYKIYQTTLHFLSIIFLVSTGIRTYQIRNDVIIFIANVDKILVAYNFLLKVVFFVMRWKEIKRLVDDISLSGDNVSEGSRNKMINHLILITTCMSVLMLGFSMLEAWMPFDPKKNKMNLALSAQVLGVTFCIPVAYRAAGMQGIICSILIYMCDQLVGLQTALKDFNYSMENERESRKEFNKIIAKHIRLMRYSTSMNAMFKEYFVIQNLAVTMELCLNAVMVVVVGTGQTVLFAGFLSYLALALLNAYIYCSLGNELMDQSENVAFAAYSSDWTSWPLNIQKDIAFITRIAQKPFQLSAGGIAVINMQTYGTALYNAYSIFTVLNDMVDN